MSFSPVWRQAPHERRTSSAGERPWRWTGFLEEFEKDEIKARVDIVRSVRLLRCEAHRKGKGLRGQVSLARGQRALAFGGP